MRRLLTLVCSASAPAAEAPSRSDLAAHANALGFGSHARAIALPGARLVAGGSGAPGEFREG